MEHPRTTSARDHDDRAIIDAAENAPSGTGRSGGNLQRDIATAAEASAIADPDGSVGVEKADTIRHKEDYPVNRAGG